MDFNLNYYGLNKVSKCQTRFDFHEKGLVGFILGTTNPLTIGISAENQWVFLLSCQSC